MLYHRIQPLFGLLAAVAVCLSLSFADARAVAEVPVSGNSPFAACSTAGSGTVYGNAETEPYVAVNPTDISNIVGVWQQDRWSNGASRGAAAAYSVNGGDSWTEVSLPFTSCVQGGLNYQRASDVWVSFGPDGTAYATALTLGQSGSSAVVSATSPDGGKNWTNPREIIVDGGNPSQFFNDKSAVTADPTHPGVAYVVWDRLESGGGDSDAGPRRGAPRAPAYFSKTADGGKTWSKPKPITSADAGEATGNQIVVDPKSGAVYDFFDLITQSTRGRLAYSVQFVKSLDGGDSWSQPMAVADIRSAPVAVPNSRTGVRAGGIIPAAGIDPNSSKLYVVWMDSRFGNGRYPEIAVSSSGDNGDSWSQPERVNTPTGGAAFTPAVAVNSMGTVASTYYDVRDRKSDSSPLLTDYWVTFSTDGAATFGGESRLAGPFDILSAPNSGGYFLGDYQGLAALSDSFIAFFVQANSGDKANPTDVETSVVAGNEPALWQVQ